MHGALGHGLGRRLGRGDDQDLGAGQELGDREGDVARPRRHVDQEELRLVPIDVGDECSNALCSMGPRQTTPSSSETKNPIEM